MVQQHAGEDCEFIYQTRPNDHFTIIANDVLRDKRLTTDAAAILFRLASHKDGWHFTAATLAAEWPGLSNRAAERAIRLLRDCGYIHRIVTRRGQRLATTLIMITPATGNCETSGCQDCSDPAVLWGHKSAGSERPAETTVCNQPGTVSDPAVSDGLKLLGHIEDHQVEDHRSKDVPLAVARGRGKPADDDALFAVADAQPRPGAGKPSKPVDPLQAQAQEITKAAYDHAHGLLGFPAVLKIVTRALKAGEWDADEIRDALIAVIDAGKPVLFDTLRGQLTVGDRGSREVAPQW
jgi:hypothetical protein